MTENKRSLIQSKLHISCLGKFDVSKDGKSLVMSSSSSKKIWELYQFMLTYRGRSFTPESLMDQLWVNQEYSDPRGTLRRQMHRLRQILGESDNSALKSIIFSNGYYKWNNEIEISVDTDIFSKFVKQGDAFIVSDSLKALDAYEKAINIYIGDYLPGCFDQHWVFPVRTQFHRSFLTTILNSIIILKDMNRYKDILKLCEKGIQVDIYEEIFHIHLMETLLHLGEHRQAAEHYGYITNYYNKEMGVSPSYKMKTLYKRILSNNQLIQSEENLHEALDTDTDLNNAFYCEPDVFKSIYELDRRRNERSSISSGIGILTISHNPNYTHAQKELRINQLKKHLLTHLRKGDTLTQWNDNQFLVLLLGVDTKQCVSVLQRVLDKSIDFVTVSVDLIHELSSAPTTQLSFNN